MLAQGVHPRPQADRAPSRTIAGESSRACGTAQGREDPSSQSCNNRQESRTRLTSRVPVRARNAHEPLTPSAAAGRRRGGSRCESSMRWCLLAHGRGRGRDRTDALELLAVVSVATSSAAACGASATINRAGSFRRTTRPFWHTTFLYETTVLCRVASHARPRVVQMFSCAGVGARVVAAALCHRARGQP